MHGGEITSLGGDFDSILVASLLVASLPGGEMTSYQPWVLVPPARQAKNPHPFFYRRKSTIFQLCWKLLNRLSILIRKTRELSQRRNRQRKPNLQL